MAIIIGHCRGVFNGLAMPQSRPGAANVSANDEAPRGVGRARGAAAVIFVRAMRGSVPEARSY
jgi:hypothetical protein